MAKFFVGQRVRLVRATNQANNGITGCIEQIQAFAPGDKLPNGKRLAGRITCDCWIRLDSARHDGHMAGANAFWQIEPILPEGSAPSVYTFQQLMGSLQGATA